MARYTASAAEITSIANAIRAKTNDNSPLVFPTGFVNAINGITADAPFTGLGKNVTLLDTVYDNTITLSDTSFNASSVTTTNTTIYNESALTPITNLSADYEYTQMITASVLYQYLGTPEQSGMPLETYYIALIPFGAQPSTPASLAESKYNYISYSASISKHASIFYTPSGALSLTANAYGVNFTSVGMDFTNRASNIFGTTLYTPRVRIQINNSYVKADAINALDPDNTLIHMKVELYRSNNNLHKWTWQLIKNLYDQTHNTTT